MKIVRRCVECSEGIWDRSDAYPSPLYKKIPPRTRPGACCMFFVCCYLVHVLIWKTPSAVYPAPSVFFCFQKIWPSQMFTPLSGTRMLPEMSMRLLWLMAMRPPQMHMPRIVLAALKTRSLVLTQAGFEVADHQALGWCSVSHWESN